MEERLRTDFWRRSYKLTPKCDKKGGYALRDTQKIVERGKLYVEIVTK